VSGAIAKIKDVARATLDGWMNTFTGLGAALHDPLVSTQATKAANKSEDYYENLIRTNGLARRIARLPAREMLRQGYEIEVADDPDYDERPVMQEVERLQLDAELVWAMTLARAVGGAVLIPIIDDGAVDLREPLNYDRIRNISEIKVLSKKCATRIAAGSPIFRIHYPGTSLPVVEMHETRLLVFDGERTTDDAKAGNNGWGDSIFVALEESLARLGTSWQALGNMLVDGSIGVLKLLGFHEMVAGHADGDEAMSTRLRIMARGRSVARTYALDAEKEDFTWQNRSFSGIPESLYAIMSELSSETGIPITKLFGRSAAGMNATGEGDAKDWYNEVGADRTEKLTPQHKRVIRMVMVQKKPDLGKEPKSWSIAYNPLWQTSDVEQADVRVKTSQADASDIAKLREPLAEGDETATAAPAGGGEDVQKAVLNGAQLEAISGFVKSVAAGEMPRESGKQLIITALEGLADNPEQRAELMLADAGAGFKPTPKEPPPGQEPDDERADPDVPAFGSKKRVPKGQGDE
jgi:phage-related protein (TIGR01555 family)